MSAVHYKRRKSFVFIHFYISNTLVKTPKPFYFMSQRNYLVNRSRILQYSINSRQILFKNLTIILYNLMSSFITFIFDISTILYMAFKILFSLKNACIGQVTPELSYENLRISFSLSFVSVLWTVLTLSLGSPLKYKASIAMTIWLSLNLDFFCFCYLQHITRSWNNKSVFYLWRHVCVFFSKLLIYIYMINK